MRYASAGMISHLNLGETTLAWLWKVERTDGQVYGFTTHDKDLDINGVTNAAASGFAASAAQARLGTSVNNLDISGAISAEVITREDILAGIWDESRVTVDLCNWANLSDSTINVQSGTLGNVQVSANTFVCEIRGISQKLQNTVGRVLTRRCDADFGDARCGIDLALHTVTGTVSASSTDRMNFTASGLPSRAGGLLTFTSGLNVGRSMEIKTAVAGSIALVLPMPYAIEAGDAYTATAGCDRNRSTCRDTYANAVNMRGIPDTPGPDAILQYPDAS